MYATRALANASVPRCDEIRRQHLKVLDQIYRYTARVFAWRLESPGESVSSSEEEAALAPLCARPKLLFVFTFCSVACQLYKKLRS